MRYKVYRIRRLRIGQNLVVQYGRVKAGTGNYNCTNVERIHVDVSTEKCGFIERGHC